MCIDVVTGIVDGVWVVGGFKGCVCVELVGLEVGGGDGGVGGGCACV